MPLGHSIGGTRGECFLAGHGVRALVWGRSAPPGQTRLDCVLALEEDPKATGAYLRPRLEACPRVLLVSVFPANLPRGKVGLREQQVRSQFLEAGCKAKTLLTVAARVSTPSNRLRQCVSARRSPP